MDLVVPPARATNARIGRSRAISLFLAGALVATTLTAVGLDAWRVGAAPGDADTTYVPLNPCRLLDTRLEPDNIGNRMAPLGPGEVFIAQVSGSNGNCTDIPTNATGAALNVTVVNPTASSNLRVYPADLTDPPLVSNLNYGPDSPATPNKVDTRLSPSGEITILNAFGTVDVIVDVVGVYTPNSLASLHNRLAAAEAAGAARDAAIADLDGQRITAQSSIGGTTEITNDHTVVLQSSMEVSRPGTAVVIASAIAVERTAGEDVRCGISRAGGGVDLTNAMFWEAAGVAGQVSGEGDAGNLASAKTFKVGAGDFTTLLMCQNTDPDGMSAIWSPRLVVMFIPDPS